MSGGCPTRWSVYGFGHCKIPQSGHIVRKDLFKQKSSAFVSFSDDTADTAVHGYLGMLDGAVFDGNTLTGQLALPRCLDKSWQVFSTFVVWLFLGFQFLVVFDLVFFGTSVSLSYWIPIRQLIPGDYWVAKAHDT